VAVVAWHGHPYLAVWSLEFFCVMWEGVLLCVCVSSERLKLMPEVLQLQETGESPIFEVVVGMRK